MPSPSWFDVEPRLERSWDPLLWVSEEKGGFYARRASAGLAGPVCRSYLGKKKPDGEK